MELAAVRPQIALPCQPSNAGSMEEHPANLVDIPRGAMQRAAGASGWRASLSLHGKMRRDGLLQVLPGVIPGCSGGQGSNVMQAERALRSQPCGNGESTLAVYPSTQPVSLVLAGNGAGLVLRQSGTTMRTVFSGPCCGTGDTPGNNCLSMRHTTRQGPNRGGSKPGASQLPGVALMATCFTTPSAAADGVLSAAPVLASETWD